MSWPNRTQRGSRFYRAIIFAGFGAILSLGSGGCAFQPLYGPTASGANMADVLKSVQITPIPGRVGQRLRNELIYNTTGGGEAEKPVYRLDIAIRESVSNTLVTQAGAPSGQYYELSAEFRLVRIKDNETLFKGTSASSATYDLSGNVGLSGSVYGDIRAPIDAQNRAARTLGDTLKTRLAAFLSRSA